jgi:hypothetical protein
VAIDRDAARAAVFVGADGPSIVFTSCCGRRRAVAKTIYYI